jgi:amidase
MPNLSETVRRLPGKQPIHPTILSVGHPGFCLSLGKDEAGMPFGLQIVGPRGGDAIVLGVAAALEAACADDATLRRPVPDLARLSQAPHFRDWD